MISQQLRDDVSSILRDEVEWKGPLPQGELGKHLDSLQCMALIVAIEDRFRICFDPEDERAILTMDDLLGCVAGKLKTLEARP